MATSYRHVGTDTGIYQLDSSGSTVSSETSRGYNVVHESPGDYIYASSGSTLYQFDSSLNAQWSASCRGSIEDIVTDESGKVYVVTYDYTALQAFNASDGSLAWEEYSIWNIGTSDWCYGITVDKSNGWIYISPTDGATQYVNKYDFTGSRLESASYSTAEGYCSTDYDGSGDLFISDRGGGTYHLDVSSGSLPGSASYISNTSTYTYDSHGVGIDNDVYIRGDGGGVKKMLAGGSVSWTRTFSTSVKSTSTSTDKVWALLGNGDLKVLDKSDGSTLDTYTVNYSSYTYDAEIIPQGDVGVNTSAWSTTETVTATQASAAGTTLSGTTTEFITATQTGGSATALTGGITEFVSATPSTSTATALTGSLTEFATATQTSASATSIDGWVTELLGATPASAQAATQGAVSSLTLGAAQPASMATALSGSSLERLTASQPQASGTMLSGQIESLITATVVEANATTADTSVSGFTLTASQSTAGATVTAGETHFTEPIEAYPFLVPSNTLAGGAKVPNIATFGETNTSGIGNQNSSGFLTDGKNDAGSIGGSNDAEKN